MKLKFKCLLFLLLPLLAQAHNGSTIYKRTIVKEFTVNDNATLNLSNKYGKIIFHAWNKNEIKATITVTGFGKNDEQAKAIAELVEVNTNQGNNGVSLTTYYNPSKNNSGWFSWGGKMDSKDYVNIDYDIYIPQSLQNLMVKNQFGDVIADKFSFPVTLEMNYCTFDIREAQDLVFKINYCDKGKVGKAANVRVRGNYSAIRGGQLESLDANSNYSEYAFNRVGSLRISSNYDDYKMDVTGAVSGRGTYSDVRLRELQQSVDLNMTYGDVKIEKVGNGFKQADFQLTYSDLNISFGSRQPLSIEANLVNGDLDTGGLELKNVISNKMNSNLRFKALAGGGSESSPYIKIRGTNTDVKLGTY
ncbi:hypothetical protein [Chitinophaga ginsengisegetis]|uniref:hypothetical protein n=1 Tax=Chitinophaga ginsengisegetis TaxID=393003 RepID=UPI000DBA4819|nr:hypothetical protein [Chitinophaga ginsengisegetis]MDR6569311.1 hypothetical protein [Chitinophaga ginsengisegetis]MDR6648658.1 hypothetical protein [Chitinophaga ginsengisegetis]MDR6655394.1 hypothetical protein [Chitinophaga ginsengisegetis]